jgi:protein-tyrosine-phosphatase
MTCIEVVCEANRGRSKFGQLFIQRALDNRSVCGVTVSSTGVLADKIGRINDLSSEEFFGIVDPIIQEAYGRGAITPEELDLLENRERDQLMPVIIRLRKKQEEYRIRFLEEQGLPADLFTLPSIQTVALPHSRLILPTSERVEREVRRIYASASLALNIGYFGYFPDPIHATSYEEYSAILRRIEKASDHLVDKLFLHK